MLRDLVMAGMLEDVDVVHCHTWYTHLAGCLVKQLTGARLVLTTHSLEPHRPWKVEQLGTAYHASSWVERTAYENADGVIAVSESMREDVHALYGVPYEKIRVIHNGIDLNQYRPTPDPAVLAKYEIDPDEPFVLFVGRITRQKGIIHLVNAIKHIRPGVQVVLCAGAPDTRGDRPRDGGAGRAGPPRVRRPDHLDRPDRPQGGDHPALHARGALRLPVGLRAVRDHQPRGDGLRDPRGRLGGRRDQGGGRPRRRRACSCRSSRSAPRTSSRRTRRGSPTTSPPRVNQLLDDPERLREMGLRSRERVEHYFSWTSIARLDARLLLRPGAGAVGGGAGGGLSGSGPEGKSVPGTGSRFLAQLESDRSATRCPRFRLLPVSSSRTGYTRKVESR